MKKIIILIILLAGGWFGYRHFFKPPSEAVLTYQKFADALALNRFSTAEELAAGDALEFVYSFGGKYETSRKSGGNPFVNATKQMAKDMRGVSNGTFYQIAEEITSDRGDEVRIRGIQTDSRSHLTGGAMWKVRKEQFATLQLQDGVWKVIRFSEKIL